ncbi:hypothetical protein [Sinorhizobium meliloti]|uniref:hypothetical protein n=1 Tax=Rhizobium meliloti TaxID=382 RepID=UPI000FD7873A|nr:hypothetical protein [Sinorhizobium meliloti]RVH53714.1 hypothetical protein CN212_01050 [Sinorhizobium meliloti]
MVQGEENEGKKLSGGFFAVDARRWKEACADGMNSAVSYLILCRGSGSDNRTTSWSVRAIETYTSIARTRAKEAIDVHLKRGRLVQLKGGRHPQYRITPYGDEATEPKWIWLPNAIIDGAAGEVSPVEKIRGGSNVKALRLFVELYESHLLETEGGIEWRRGSGIRVPYYGDKVVDWGEYTIWSFEQSEKNQTWTSFAPRLGFESDDEFWQAWKQLAGLGLFYVVAHLVESDSQEGEIIHPLPYDTDGSELEKDIAVAAHSAAWEMLADWRKEQPDFDADSPLVPVLRHLENVALIGIYRLRYKPHTRATVKWVQKQMEWAALADDFRELEERACGRTTKDFKVMQYQG